MYPTSPSPDDELQRIRRSIDALDDRLLHLLARRLDLARSARAPKARAGLPLHDLAREAAVVRRATHAARARGLDPEGVRDIFWRLVELGRRAQEADTVEAGGAPRADGGDGR